MAKRTISEMQDSILNQFERTIRNAQRNPQPTLVEQIMAESKIKQAAWEAKKASQPAKPFISFYNPDNPLHQLKGLNKYERKIKTAELKRAGLIK
jgi:hypothetical protein